ncbi:MAG: class I SAM-dependent methyltransferase [Thermomicrobiales bacterium]
MAEGKRDIWAEWLLHRRFGCDPDQQRQWMEELRQVRDKVLANARINAGKTLLDVGAGDGLIAFGAIAWVGDQVQIIFSDVSQDLLDHSRAVAEQMGVAGQIQFVRAAAEELWPIADASVDVVTTRSVLIYVAEKQRAFDEFFRVLRPGGRISLFEPINRFNAFEPPDRLWGLDVSPVQDIVAKVRTLYQRLQPLNDDPMLNFDERDLLAFAEHAGFPERHLEYRVDIEPRKPQRWETYLNSSGNPRIPTLAEAMAEVLSPAERERYEAHLRPRVEQGRGTTSSAIAYLWAAKR